MPRKLDGPRLKPKSGRAKQLVVLLHGYGADGRDLIDMGRSWQDLLPDTAFISPHAPEPCGMSPQGRQWWALTMRDPSERWRGVNAVQGDVDAFVDEELAKLGLDPHQLALVGFSQGAMTALHVGLRRMVPPAAILSYSGFLVGPEHLKEQASGKPPILLVHGDQDNVIPADALFEGMNGLAKAEIPCQWHLSMGIGHGIDQGGLTHGGLFLSQSFKAARQV